jgi:hypothetical protein
VRTRVDEWMMKMMVDVGKKKKESEKKKGDRLIGFRSKESTTQSIHQQIKN